MSQLGLNIGNKYDIISTPLNVSELSESQLIPNQLIISSVPNENGDDTSVDLVATDNNGYLFNITDSVNTNANIKKVCNEIGNVFMYQINNPNKNLTFEIQKQISYINNDIVIDANNNIQSYSDAYIYAYVSNCFSPQYSLDNNILTISLIDSSQINSYTVSYHVTMTPNKDAISINGTGIYKTVMSLHTNIPNVINKATITTKVHGPKFITYLGILSGLVDEVINNAVNNNSYFMNNDCLYIDTNIYPYSNTFTFINNIVTMCNNNYTTPSHSSYRPIVRNVYNSINYSEINNNYSDYTLVTNTHVMANYTYTNLAKNDIISDDIINDNYSMSGINCYLNLYNNAYDYIYNFLSNEHIPTQSIGYLYDNYIKTYCSQYTANNISMKYGCWCIIPKDIYDNYNIQMFESTTEETRVNTTTYWSSSYMMFEHYNGNSYEDLVLLKFYDMRPNKYSINDVVSLSQNQTNIININFIKK